MTKDNSKKTEVSLDWEYFLSHYFLSRKEAFAQWNRDKNEWQCVRRDIPDYLIKITWEVKLPLLLTLSRN